MIDFIKGKLVHSFGDSIVVENNGIGFKIHTSIGSVADFSSLGEEVVVYTELIVREDSMSLVGFSSRDELNMFQLLTSVSGIGTKVGIGILSSMPFGQLAGIIASQDIKSLQSAQGVGKKTAERLLLELKGKLGADIGMPLGAIDSAQGDILQALLALGYSDKEAAAALKALPKDVGVSEGIKLALRALAK